MNGKPQMTEPKNVELTLNNCVHYETNQYTVGNSQLSACVLMNVIVLSHRCSIQCVSCKKIK